MTFDSKKILKELYDNEETCSFRIDCVMDGDFDDIRRIIEDECEDCGVSDRLAKKVRILKNDDNCYTICCPSKEVCDLLSNKFEEIGIYGKPSNEAKDYRSSIEKYNAEDDIVEPDKSKGKVKVDGDTMYAEDGDCGMTSGDAGAYDAPFEIPTKYSKKQMDMIRRGTLENRMNSRKSKRVVKESVEEDLFDAFYKDIKDNYKYYDYRTSDLKTFDHGDLIEFLYRFMSGSKIPKSFEEIQQLSDYENYKNMASSILDAWTKYDLVEDIRNNHRLYQFK